MKNLGGSSFDLNDFLGNGTRDDFTPGERISSLLNDIDDFVIQDKKVEKNRIDDNIDDMEESSGEVKDYKDEDNEQVVSVFDLDDTVEAGKNRAQHSNRYEVFINEDDVYIPIDGESKQPTKISSMEISEPTFVLEEDDVEKDKNFRTLNTRTILDLSGEQTDEITPTNKKEQEVQEQSTPAQGMDSLQLLAELGLDASPVKIKSNNKKKKQTNIEKSKANKNKATNADTNQRKGSEVDDTDKPNKTKTRRANKPILKEQDPNNMVEDNVTPVSQISNTSNRNLFNSLVSQMSVNSKEDEENKIDLTISKKVREVMDNLDDFEMNFGRRNMGKNSDKEATSISERLTSTIETTGKHFIEVDLKDLSTEVQSILENVYDLDVISRSTDYVVMYKEIPTGYQEQRNIYLKEILLKFRKLLIKINGNYKATNSKLMQTPLVFNCRENGVPIVTPLELKMIISSIDKGYSYEIQEDKILLWGVK